MVECVVLVKCKHFVLHTISNVWISDYSCNTGTELTGLSMQMVGRHTNTACSVVYLTFQFFSMAAS